MSREAIILMSIAWTAIFALTLFCLWRLERK